LYCAAKNTSESARNSVFESLLETLQYASHRVPFAAESQCRAFLCLVDRIGTVPSCAVSRCSGERNVWPLRGGSVFD
jgi:hypothetical protein